MFMHQIPEQKQAKIDRPTRRNRQMHEYCQGTPGELCLMNLDAKILNKCYKIKSNNILKALWSGEIHSGNTSLVY